MRKRAIYLKINRDEKFAILNLSRWIDVAYLSNLDCYILCDKEELISKIKNEIALADRCEFIKSRKDDEIRDIVLNIANKNWENAAYAHYTTFVHSVENDYEYFWNVDADDTMVCLSVDRMAEMLQTVVCDAELSDVDITSLDMWRTKWNGMHWSFGITYASNKKNWKHLIELHCCDSEYHTMENGMNYNIDCFFAYLKEVSDRKIETYYFENLKFIHYSGDFFKGLISSAFYHWKDGKLTYPLMKACIGINEMSEFDIYEDIKRFDIGISDEEARDILTYYSRDEHEFRGLVDWSKIVNRELFELKKKYYMDQKNLAESSEIICFGVGNCFDNSFDKIKSICELKCVCDNDEGKWGKEFNGVKCIEPSELAKLRNVFIIITIYSKVIAQKVASQLENMGINNYDYIDNFLKCVE